MNQCYQITKILLMTFLIQSHKGVASKNDLSSDIKLNMTLEQKDNFLKQVFDLTGICIENNLEFDISSEMESGFAKPEITTEEKYDFNVKINLLEDYTKNFNFTFKDNLENNLSETIVSNGILNVKQKIEITVSDLEIECNVNGQTWETEKNNNSTKYNFTSKILINKLIIYITLEYQSNHFPKIKIEIFNFVVDIVKFNVNPGNESRYVKIASFLPNFILKTYNFFNKDIIIKKIII